MIKFSFSVAADNTAPIEQLIRQKLRAQKIEKTEILKKSIDARKKDKVQILYTVACQTENDKKYISRDAEYYEQKDYSLRALVKKEYRGSRPLVVGAGPAGLFCALTLAYAGARPLLLERGEGVEERAKSVERFFQTLSLNPNSNIQFGEGGAGTFSDGKLNTNLHNEYIPVVLKEFTDAGAPEEILYLAKPHIGTDYLTGVVRSLRQKIIALGGEVLYNTRLTDIETDGNKITAAVTERGKIDCEHIFLAVGHSARDTFETLFRKGVVMTSKTFSMGVRIEHTREFIDRTQYGSFASVLPAADYKMATSTDTGRSLYTFCMCPGGEVVNASSEEGGVCINGMSRFARNARNSNAALLVNVDEKDWQSEHPLAGMEFQRTYERKVFAVTGAYRPVVQTLEDFRRGKSTSTFGEVLPSVAGAATGDLRACLPKAVAETLLSGIESFGRKMKGFDRGDSVLSGIEARSSSPVRIVRDEGYRASTEGLYPLGEGAGYAGGITSAAIDGIKGALALLDRC